MGAEVAVHARNNANFTLLGFADVTVLEISLGRGRWVVLGRVTMINLDSDQQPATAKLVYDINATIDVYSFWPYEVFRGCVALQGVVDLKNEATVVALQCNTYKGQAEYASLVAFPVDTLDPPV